MDRNNFPHLVIVILAFATLFLAGCGSGDNESLSESSKAVFQDASLPWIERYFLLGQEAYNTSCASCHNEGKDGAPMIGNRDAWSGRSPLWSAVLLEHAKKGYLQMPAKGGFPELTDRLVEAAGEYMLSVTFPELPRG